jgi:DNA-binding LacI/PurR family transcriptional regulator
VNIRDLAKHLNISIGTVSRALNGRPYVDEATRARVLAAAAQFGYSPNFAGRSLRQGTTGMVAMMLPTSDGVVVADTIFMMVLEGLRRFFLGQKLDLLVLLAEPENTDFSYLRRVADRGLVDGVIIADILQHDPRIDYLLGKNLPFVAYGRSRTPGRYAWIDFDIEGATTAAVERLVRRGYDRIGLGTLTPGVNYGAIVEETFRQVMDRHGLAVDPVIYIEASEQGGYAFGEKWLQATPRPKAVLLASARMAIGFYKRLAEAGLAAARDVAVVAVVEEPNARYLRPQLTHFSVDLQGLGVRLGEALLLEMQDRRRAPVQELFPMRLSLGDSDSGPV